MRRKGERSDESVPQTSISEGAAAEASRRWPDLWQRRQRALVGLLGIAIVLGSWEAFADFKLVNPVISSKPSAIAIALGHYFDGGGRLHALQVSAAEFVIGFSLALIVGLLLGLAIGWWRTLNYLFDPLITFGYAVPHIALVPLFVVWFGIGLESKLAIVFLSAFFPILLNTISGVKTTDA